MSKLGRPSIVGKRQWMVTMTIRVPKATKKALEAEAQKRTKRVGEKVYPGEIARQVLDEYVGE